MKFQLLVSWWKRIIRIIPLDSAEAPTLSLSELSYFLYIELIFIILSWYHLKWLIDILKCEVFFLVPSGQCLIAWKLFRSPQIPVIVLTFPLCSMFSCRHNKPHYLIFEGLCNTRGTEALSHSLYVRNHEFEVMRHEILTWRLCQEVTQQITSTDHLLSQGQYGEV